MADVLAPWQQLPMYAVSDELAPTVATLGLEQNLNELRDNGYTIIAVDRALSDRLRAAILRSVEDAPGPNASFDRGAQRRSAKTPSSKKRASIPPSWRWPSTSAAAAAP